MCIRDSYNIDQTAEAIRLALAMEPEEKELRMRNMRKTVREHNVYRWAGSLIAELCDLRLDASDESQEKPRAVSYTHLISLKGCS